MTSPHRQTIDSTFGIPENLAEAASAREFRPAWKVRTPIWQRIISMAALGGIAGAIGVALAVSLIGVAILTLMLLEAAIG